jgi:serine/threonine protein kinase/energy-coupling factor transporter ATP-binding protein EcfA2
MKTTYQVGNPVRAGGTAVYVRRPCDDLAEAALQSGSICHIFASRRMGKTSFATRICAERRTVGEIAALILGDLCSSPAALRDVIRKWLRGLGGQTGVDVAGAIENLGQDLTSGAEIFDYFWGVVSSVATALGRPLTLFIDEVDTVIWEKWLDGAFFHSLRDASVGGGLANVAIGLLGYFPPRHLIEPARVTPFNIGHQVVFQDFAWDMRDDLCLPLKAAGMSLESTHIVADRVFEHTDGHPALTIALLNEVLAYVKAQGTGKIPNLRGTLGNLIWNSESTKLSSETNSIYAHVRRDLLPGKGTPLAREVLEIYRELLMRDSRQMLYQSLQPSHLCAELYGLAKKVTDPCDGEVYLRVRNETVTDCFDLPWVEGYLDEWRRETGEESVQSSAPVFAPARDEHLEAMIALVQREFVESEIGQASQRRLVDGTEEVLRSGVHYRFILKQAQPRSTLELQLFRGIGDLGSALWEREVKLLKRLSSLGHPALPQVREGGVLRHDDVAFVLSRYTGGPLTDSPEAYDYFHKEKLRAVREMADLFEALKFIHQDGIVHRNISPRSIRCEPGEEDGHTLRIEGFEFSTMLRSIIGQHDSGSVLLDHGQDWLPVEKLYKAPEVLLKPDSVLHDKHADVFSLCMVLFQLLIRRVEPERVEAVFAASAYDQQRHRDLLEDCHRGLAESKGHDPLITSLLRRGLSPDPANRPSAEEIHDALIQNWRQFQTYYEATGRPRLLCYSLRHTAEQLRAMGLFTNREDTSWGEDRIHNFIEEQLRQARYICLSEMGYAPFTEYPTPAHSVARYVIVCPQVQFFCQYFERRRNSGASTVVHHALRLAYTLDNRWNRAPHRLSKTTSMPILWELVLQTDPELKAERDGQYGTWLSILREVEKAKREEWATQSIKSFTFLNSLHQEQINLLRFPIRPVEAQEPNQACFVLDEDSYRRYAMESPLRSLVFEQTVRGLPSSFFENKIREVLDQNGLVRIEERSREVGVRARSKTLSIESMENGIVALSAAARDFREGAWLEPGSRRAQMSPLRRQLEAISTLNRNSALHSQLNDPQGHIFHPKDRRDVGAGLAPPTPDIINRILNTEPFFALQGPPGSGKTTVVSRCVGGLLQEDDTMRILVTAQSHAALDNLALRIHRHMAEEASASGPERHIMIRLSTAATEERVDPMVSDVMGLDKQKDKLIQAMLSSARRGKAQVPEGSILARAYKALKLAATEGALEVRDRVEHSANVVFCTTAAATRNHLKLDRPQDYFDIAIVEEASKAWGTEQLMPLVVSHRAIMIGDHRQLPAFGEIDVERILAACQASEDENIRAMAVNAEVMRGWFNPFKRIFDQGESPISSEPGASRAKSRPVDMLSTQFRMAPPIAALISNCFYDGRLKTDPSVADRPRRHRFDHPLLKDAPPLVWIDTSGGGAAYQCNDRGGWVNSGEAQFIKQLLTSRLPESGNQSVQETLAGLAILSPFNRQKQRLQNALRQETIMLGGIVPAEKVLHTVDSFQGAEADTVIVSLTRSRKVRPNEAVSPLGLYGFLCLSQRVNVMLSRAREMLVVVGNLSYFGREWSREEDAEFAPFWRDVIEHFQTSGRIIPVKDAEAACGRRGAR